jgi:hypothetical protein
MVTGRPVHRLEDLREVVALDRQDLRERRCALGLRDSPGSSRASRGARRVEEHVLGAAEADALGAELAATLGVGAGVGVGAHA